MITDKFWQHHNQLEINPSLQGRIDNTTLQKIHLALREGKRLAPRLGVASSARALVRKSEVETRKEARKKSSGVEQYLIQAALLLGLTPHLIGNAGLRMGEFPHVECRLGARVQRLLIKVMFHLEDSCLQRLFKVKNDLWQGHCSGALGVTLVARHCNQMTGCVYLPTVTEDVKLGVDLIYLDSQLPGKCFQVKASRKTTQLTFTGPDEEHAQQRQTVKTQNRLRQNYGGCWQPHFVRLGIRPYITNCQLGIEKIQRELSERIKNFHPLVEVN